MDHIWNGMRTEDEARTIGVLRENPYDQGNAFLASWCRAMTVREHIYYFEDININEMFTLGTQQKKIEGKMVEDIVLNWKGGKEQQYSAIQTCIGSFFFSTMTYDGNWLETDPQLKPKTERDVKQGVQFSLRAYTEEGRDTEEPSHDKLGMKFVAFATKLTRDWLCERLKDIGNSEALEKHIRKCKEQLKKEGVKSPTNDDVFRVLRNYFILELARRDKYDQYSCRFSTKLFRFPYENEKTVYKTMPYLAPTPWMQSVYREHGLVFNDIPIYTLRSDAELQADWATNKTLFKRIPRDKLVIRNGDLGVVRFYPGATNGAGDKCAISGYLHSIVWYGEGTDLSRMVPQKPLDADAFLHMQDVPKLPGSSCYMDKFAMAQRPAITDGNESKGPFVEEA
jgi:hypothetical protein